MAVGGYGSWSRMVGLILWASSRDEVPEAALEGTSRSLGVSPQAKGSSS